MAPAKDPFAEFKGKQKLTEREVNLLLKRLNDGKIEPSQMRQGGYALTPDQAEKGRKWLMNLWRTPTGAERKNSPFGSRETGALETFKTIRLADVYDTSYYGGHPYYIPVYEVIAGKGYFMYYVNGGKISIVG